MHYHIGSNTPGYMPDEVPEPVSQGDAYRVLVADMTAWAEDDDESCGQIPDPDAKPDSPRPEDFGSALAEVQALLRDDGAHIRQRLSVGAGVSLYLMGNDGRSRVFFAAPEDDEDGCEVEL